MKPLLSVLLVVTAFAAPPCVALGQSPKPDRPPNVVLILADDLGYGDLSCYGGAPGVTPNLDRLAREGTRLTDFYAAQAVCSASRTAFLTGRLPNHVGILNALPPSAENGIRPEETTLGELFKSRGYATAIFGKWHLGHRPEFLPTRHGFDEYYGLPYSNDMGPLHPTHKFPPLPVIEGEHVIELNPDQSRLTTDYTERAIRFIEQNAAAERPFFLYLPHTMPHVPLFVSKERAGATGRGLYYDVIHEIDWSVGEITKTLNRIGLTNDTIVIFSSDNGPWLEYGDHAGSTGDMREGKGTTFEGGVRVPFLVRWPGRVPSGKICTEPVMSIDVLPTLAHWIGCDTPQGIEGVDISAYLEGKAREKPAHEALFFYWQNELQAVRSGPWKLHLPHRYVSLQAAGSGGKPGRMSVQTIGLSLFNLAQDPAESRDVAAEHPDVVERLSRLAEAERSR